MRTAAGARAARLHLPVRVSNGSTGAVVCAPVGYEYTHSYRSLLHLADRLAGAGVPTLCFDFHGSGSSVGDALDPDLVRTWVADVEAAIELMREITGRPPTIIGLRLGATLGAVAASQNPVRSLVAWAPIVRPLRWLREQRALAHCSTNGVGHGSFEVAGFSVSEQTSDALAAIDLTELDYRITGDALVLPRADLTSDGALTLHLRSTGVRADQEVATGYTEMMEKPHRTKVPDRTIDSIVRWVAERSVQDRSPGRLPPLETAVVHQIDRGRMIEEFIEVPGSPALAGVLTTAPPTKDSSPLLVLTNAGSAHTAGPNRVYVELSRKLAGAGYSTLRLDLRNLGDSIRGSPPHENHPYPPTAVDDVARALEWLETTRGVKDVVIGGLCSGAYTAFRCGSDLRHSAIRGIVMINPLTFHWSEGDEVASPSEVNPNASVRDPGKWRKLRRGAYGPSDLFRFAAGRLAAGSRAILRRVGRSESGPVASDLRQCARTGRHVDLVFSRFDPGYAMLETEAPSTLRELRAASALTVSFVEDADHTFSLRPWREALADVVIERLETYG